MYRSLSLILLLGAAAPAQNPVDVTPGPGLKGWHVSQVNHHGNTSWKAEQGVVSGTQDHKNIGGILLTDAKYRNFEISFELKPDYGCDGGLFLRSNEKGEAYQVMLDYLPSGNMGGVYGEGLKNVKGVQAEWERLWKQDEWNSMRVRIEGDVPHIQVWMNDVRITDWKDTENHLPDSATEGMIAVQVHGGTRCSPGLYHRFRKIVIQELKPTI